MNLLPSPTTGAEWFLREDAEPGIASPNVAGGTNEAVVLGLPTRVTVIALGSQVAVLLNGEPLAFYTDSRVRGQGYILTLGAAQQIAEVHFDNIRFWDISDLTASNPAATATAMPSWVTDFAEPIVQAIESRTPDFGDDFTSPSASWGWGEPIGFENGSLRMDSSGSDHFLQAYL